MKKNGAASPRRGRKRKHKVIYLVGEMTGGTISKIAKASLAQFNRQDVEVKKFFQIRSEDQLESIMAMAEADEALVAFSVIYPPLRDFLVRQAESRGIKAIDVIGNFIMQLSVFLDEKPVSVPGRQYILDDHYYRMIEGINFAVKNDDGKMPQNLKHAELVLIGLSRTSKTPLSTYLGHQGWKVANVPLHPDMDTPAELFQVDPKRVFCLTIRIDSLMKLRAARLEQLGLGPGAKYADPVVIAGEIEWCEDFFGQNPQWRVLDISDMAIEETAATILTALKDNHGK